MLQSAHMQELSTRIGQKSWINGLVHPSDIQTSRRAGELFLPKLGQNGIFGPTNNGIPLNLGCLSRGDFTTAGAEAFALGLERSTANLDTMITTSDNLFWELLAANSQYLGSGTYGAAYRIGDTNICLRVEKGILAHSQPELFMHLQDSSRIDNPPLNWGGRPFPLEKYILDHLHYIHERQDHFQRYPWLVPPISMLVVDQQGLPIGTLGPYIEEDISDIILPPKAGESLIGKAGRIIGNARRLAHFESTDQQIALRLNGDSQVEENRIRRWGPKYLHGTGTQYIDFFSGEIEDACNRILKRIIR